MPHLPIERLAALADEPPTPAELAHLEGCAACRAEREAHGRLRTLAAGAWASVAPPLTSWEAIAERLRAEQLLAPPAPEPTRVWHRAAMRWGARAAAALFLLGGGVAAGRYSAGASLLPGAGSARSAQQPVVAGTPVMTPDDSMPADVDRPAFGSQAEALAALARAERQYQLAASYLAQQDPTAAPSDDSSAVFRTRLAALDDVTAAAREALYEAPYDPVINRYYLATMGAREATLRQLKTTLPEGRQLTRF